MTQQLDIFASPPPHGDRDGKTFVRERDGKRCNSQADAVWEIVKDHCWHTPSEIAEKVGCSDSSATARLRDLRKPRFGSHTVEREYVERGLFRYRVK